MVDRQILRWGSVPVPYAALWSGEQGKMHLATCRHAQRIACCDIEARGSGKPIFGKPHMTRQREVVINDLCDLCARPLKGRTKVSLSHSRPIVGGDGGLTIMQVEPMVHKDCAAICVQHCPSLKRDIARGSLIARHVLRHRVQLAMLTSEACQEFTNTPAAGVIGHAKVELLRWIDRDLNWIGGRDG